jgi:hypothetical protein
LITKNPRGAEEKLKKKKEEPSHAGRLARETANRQ